MSLLRVDNLTMRFGGLLAVDDVSLTAQAGQITAIIGPNGAGKTTLFNCITGFYRPTQGAITMGETPITNLPAYRVARVGVARTFQNLRLFGGLTAYENLLAARQGNEATARQWLDFFGLTDAADSRADALPYGAQRRLEMARGLCTLAADVPRLLCLDEPAAGLNPRESGELAERLRTLVTQHGVTVLLIEHDMRVVMNISDRIVVLDHGRKIADGTPAEVRASPAVIKAYLGEPDE